MSKWPDLDLTSAARDESLRDSEGELVAAMRAMASPCSCECSVSYRRNLDPARSRQVADAMVRAAMATLTRLEADSAKDLPIPYTLSERAAE